MALERDRELLERDASVAIRVCPREQGCHEPLHVGVVCGHVVLREGQRDHPHEVDAIEGAVGVVIVHAKSKEELVARRPEDQLAHPFEELVAADHAVAVGVEGREHPAREVLGAQPEGALELPCVDDRVRPRESGERALQDLHERRVEMRRWLHRRARP